MLANGTNVGRRPLPVKGGVVVSGSRPDGAAGMKPVVGRMHPWCECTGPHPYTGYESWKAKPE
jgi:hypothetical protein